MIEIQTADGGCVRVNQSIWECYFPAENRQINLPKVSALLLMKLLNGELGDQKITEWVKQQVKDMFNGQIPQFESVLSSIDVWLEVAEIEGLDAEAAEFIKGYTEMLNRRIQKLYITDESNSELYRKMHVDKNAIQRDILNTDLQPFVYPFPPPQPEPAQQPAAA